MPVLPKYMFIFLMILAFTIVLGLIIIVLYYIYRKFNSIDKFTDHNSNKTYKENKRKYKEKVDELDAKVLPDGQTVSHIADKIIEFKKK